jgi:phytol kinase
MTDWPWGSMAMVSGAYLAMFAAGELLHRRRRVSAEETRKLNHIAAGAIALSLPAIFTSAVPVVVVVSAFVVLLLLTRVAGLLPSVHGIRRATVGAYLYPVAIALSFAVAADHYPWYAIAILALALGDAVGGIAGARWGRHAYTTWGQRKTWEGSLAVLVTASTVTSLVLLLGGALPTEAIGIGLLVGPVVGLVEGALPYGLDNLGVPVAALAALAAAGSAFTAGVILVVAGAGFLGALAVSRLATGRSTSFVAAPSTPPETT